MYSAQRHHPVGPLALSSLPADTVLSLQPRHLLLPMHHPFRRPLPPILPFLLFPLLDPLHLPRHAHRPPRTVHPSFHPTLVARPPHLVTRVLEARLGVGECAMTETEDAFGFVGEGERFDVRGGLAGDDGLGRGGRT